MNDCQGLRRSVRDALTSCLREDGRTTGINPTELWVPVARIPYKYRRKV